MTHFQRIDPSPSPSDARAGRIAFASVSRVQEWARRDEARAAM
jgi:hypothetical protein